MTQPPQTDRPLTKEETIRGATHQLELWAETLTGIQERCERVIGTTPPPLERRLGRLHRRKRRLKSRLRRAWTDEVGPWESERRELLEELASFRRSARAVHDEAIA